MKAIESLDDIAEGVAALQRLDPRLVPVIAASGDIPLRRRAADFAGLAQIVTGQQVSVASAAAIFGRLEQRVRPLNEQGLASVADEDLASVGLSRPKIRTLRAIEDACRNGLDLSHLAERPGEEAHAELCAIKGIGRWTADIFLLFCAGHPDVFPSGDLALQVAVQGAFGLEDRPKPGALDEIATAWAPWRGVAARVFWAWYRVQKQGRETMPI
ncbi:DNA-3-methyladenine glycosylase 2 family protein [uncultured Roseibium sp.]|uniref:DNA-3-methyladenine glycosylase family protein n=1 Tax=uncultured Roseibium sp. TaxID=1936171 RepID=UPI003217D5D8